LEEFDGKKKRQLYGNPTTNCIKRVRVIGRTYYMKKFVRRFANKIRASLKPSSSKSQPSVSNGSTAYIAEKESTRGSYEEVKRINACEHQFADRKRTLFGYMRVDQRCILCGTWRKLLGV
jgi:hypothetical protein